MKMKRLKSLPLLVFTFLLILLFFYPVPAQTSGDTTKSPVKKKVVQPDTTKKDTTKQIPGYYKDVDVKIVYPWMPEEPQWYRNVCCQVIKEGKKVTELHIFLKTCTEKLEIKEGYIGFEIRDHKTKKLLEKGP